MATSVRRKAAAPGIDPEQTFREHILLKAQGATITTRAEALKTRLKDAFDSFANLYVSDSGSKFFDFAETISDGKVDYKGMEMRRAVNTTFNETKAELILRRKGVYEEALTPVLDQDKVYVLAAEGKISEKEVDEMFEKTERFSFYPVKGEVL